jgi:hypothetical protein
MFKLMVGLRLVEGVLNIACQGSRIQCCNSLGTSPINSEVNSYAASLASRGLAEAEHGRQLKRNVAESEIAISMMFSRSGPLTADDSEV